MRPENKAKETGLLKIERKYAWSFLGFVLAIVFGGITLYTTFLTDKSPELTFKILSNIRVLDIYAQVQDLEILYKNENIIDHGKNLSILTLKIENGSNLDILNNFYDPNNPLGLEILDGTIVEKPEIIEASNEYIKKNVLVSQKDSTNYITFSNIIIDKHQSFSVKLLILHKSDEIPVIQPIGKIAGVEEIKVIDQTKEIKISFWKRLLQGNIWIHIMRFFFYIISIAIIAVVIIMPPTLISDYFSKKRRKKHVHKYEERMKISASRSTDFIFNTYVDNSVDYLISIQDLLKTKEILREELLHFIRSEKLQRSAFKPMAQYESENIYPPSRKWVVIKDLYREELVKMDHGKLIVDSKFEAELNEFMSFIKLFY
jgi:hypothetical protein